VLESTTYRTRSEQARHYNTDAVLVIYNLLQMEYFFKYIISPDFVPWFGKNGKNNDGEYI